VTTVRYKVVECDECKHSFKLKPSKIKTEKVGEEVERTYFICPKCKYKFIVMYQDNEVKKNLKEMDNIKIKVQELLENKKDVGSLIKYYKKVYYRNLEISNKYKEVYGRYVFFYSLKWGGDNICQSQ